MITRLELSNFKSIVGATLPPDGRLGSFTCLIGANGAGKSTVLQAVDFLAQLVRGNVDEWLAQREWKPSELSNSAFGKNSPIIGFCVEFGETLSWRGKFNTRTLRCTSEEIVLNDQAVFEVADGRLSLEEWEGQRGMKSEPGLLKYTGSALSILKIKEPHPAAAVKAQLAAVKSLELLNPRELRKRSRGSPDIGAGGEKLAGFLSGLTHSQQRHVADDLRGFYHNVSELQINGERGGWKNFSLTDSLVGSSRISARHLNDGMLRVIAILAQRHVPHSMLLLEEVENGIHPELTAKLVKFLTELGNAGQQVIVTTHSPMILNFLPDQLAREAVLLVHRGHEGTRLSRFFNLPGPAAKLEALGPGEIYADTNLESLTRDLEEESVVLPES